MNRRPTRRDAQKKIEAVVLPLREEVFAFIESGGESGATDEEIQDGLEMGANTQRPRRVELVEAGRVVDSGATRLTASKRDAVVWLSVAAADALVKAAKPSVKAKKPRAPNLAVYGELVLLGHWAQQQDRVISKPMQRYLKLEPTDG